MSFLNPFFLWALPLIGVPFLLHLIFKRPPKPLVFSHIAWLKNVHQQSMPRKKLREILLLLLRTMIYLCLILFFARPLLEHGGLLQTKSETATVVFMVDVSASLGARVAGREALSLSIDEIQNALRKIPNETKLGLIAYSNQVEQEFTPSLERAKFLSLLQNLKVKPCSTDIDPAFKLAYGMMNNQPRGRKSIVVVSDQARHGFELLLKKGTVPEGYDPEVKVMMWEIIPELPNAGLRELTVGMSGEGLLKGQAHVRRSGFQNQEQGWKLNLNDRIVAQGVLGPEIKSDETLSFQAQLPEGGFYSGHLDLTPDALPFDDTYFVAGRVPKGFRLLMVDGAGGLAPSDSEVYYLDLALESPRDPRLQGLSVIRPEAFRSEDLGSCDALVLANLSDLKPELTSALHEWVEKGGGLLIGAGSKWSPKPHSYLSILSLKTLEKTHAHLVKPDSSLEFLSSIAGLNEFEWDQVDVTSYFTVDEGGGWTPLLKLDNGRPLLIMKQIGKGFVLAWLSTLDRAWTNFPAKPSFAPFMREIMSSLADPLRQQTSLNGWVGQPLRIRLPEGARSVTVVDPNGVSTGGRVSEDGILEWANTIVPGLYEIKTNQEKSPIRFAVNIPDMDKEGDLRRVKMGELKSIFPHNSLEWIASQGHSSDKLISALQGKDLTVLFLILVFIFFGFETLLSLPNFSLKLIKPAAVSLLLLLAASGFVQGGEGNKFVFTQLKYEGSWDPYPGVVEPILGMVQSLTNIPFAPQRKVVTLSDAALFEYPFLWVEGNAALNLSSSDKSRLKQFIDGGGLVFFDDNLANPKSAFAESVRLLFAELYPDRPFQRLPQDHALFRSFFLMRGVGGRRIAEKYLEGIEVGGGLGGEGRTAVIYCANDLLGVWMRDPMGAYTFVCDPGGEPQRWESFKLTLNLIYFSLTGTYKRDAIHQPFIEKKLGT